MTQEQRVEHLQDVFSAHLVVDDNATRAEATALKQQVRAMLNGHEFAHTVVEIEYANEDCLLREPATC